MALPTLAQLTPPDPMMAGMRKGAALGGLVQSSMGAQQKFQNQQIMNPINQILAQQKSRRGEAMLEVLPQQLHQQMAMNQMKADEAQHLMLSHKMADLHDIPSDQRSKEYKNILGEMKSVGFNTAQLPQTYDKTAESIANVASMHSPAAAEERKNQFTLAKQRLMNLGQIEKTMAGKAPASPEYQTAGGAQIIPTGPSAQAPGAMQQGMQPGAQPPAGAQPTAQPGMQQGMQPQQQPQVGQPAGPGFRIRPSPAADLTYQRGLGTGLAKYQDQVTDQSDKASEVLGDIQDFQRASSQVHTGPFIGRLAGLTTQGQLAIKAQNRLSLAMLSMQHFGRVTNREMSIVQKANLNVNMSPEAIQTLSSQLSAVAHRSIEYQNFVNAASNAGLRSRSQIESIWHKYERENHVIDTNTGKVNHENIGNWHKYLTPTNLRAQLEVPASIPKTFIAPGSPESRRKGGSL